MQYNYTVLSNVHATEKMILEDCGEKWKKYIKLFCDSSFTEHPDAVESTVYIRVYRYGVSLTVKYKFADSALIRKLMVWKNSTTLTTEYYAKNHKLTEQPSDTVIYYKDNIQRASVSKLTKIINTYL